MAKSNHSKKSQIAQNDFFSKLSYHDVQYAGRNTFCLSGTNIIEILQSNHSAQYICRLKNGMYKVHVECIAFKTVIYENFFHIKDKDYNYN